jgi:chloramphenicol-sensitive protein RarD
VIFRERLVRAQVAAIALAAIAVVILTIDYGRPPWIALILAASFATYGLMKKIVTLDPLRSLTSEGLVAAPFAIAYLAWLAVTGPATFDDGNSHTLLLIVSGLVTVVPLLLFGAAAHRLPLVTMGILQYLTPALQMAWGLVVGHEYMPPSRWIGFVLIWIALVVFTTDALLRARRRKLEPAVAAA